MNNEPDDPTEDVSVGIDAKRKALRISGKVIASQRALKTRSRTSNMLLNS